MRWLLVWGALPLLMAVAPVAPVHADSLSEALADAYMGNPTLLAARAGQRATDEQVSQALSGWRPTVTVESQIGPDSKSTTSYKSSLPPFKTLTRNHYSTQGGLSITLSQPLFRGFATVEGTKAAEAQVKAGQQNLLSVEQNTLFNAVQAYINVYADRQLVALQLENVDVLKAQLDASNERFKVGDNTKTDVAQARASLAQAKAAVSNARATLAADVAKYVQIIGHEPGKLSYPSFSRLPPSLESAYAQAGQINPNILAASYVEEASLHNIEVKRAALLPRVSLQANLSVNDDLTTAGGTVREGSVSAVLSMPLYEAGSVYSSVREAKQLASQKRIQVIEMARAVRQAVAASWNFLAASRLIIDAANEQVAAARIALDGVRQEYTAGTRTTLDVLNTQATVVNAKTTLVNAQRGQVVAAYQLLAAIGKLTARDLALKVPYYDPEQNYQAVRNKWIGTGADTLE
jgi:outer membrane protein